MAKHYDVVVIGAGLGTLTAAALLARRTWRVLVVGHGYRPQRYHVDDLPLTRRSHMFLGYSSPVFSRVLTELAQSMVFRRRVREKNPMLQLFGPGIRLDVPPSLEKYRDELAREMPGIERTVAVLYEALSDENGRLDKVFEHDAVFPPQGFWQRRETDKIVAPLLRPIGDFLGEFPADHAYRDLHDGIVEFATDLVGVGPRAAARLHGAMTRGLVSLSRGEDELFEFLCERIRAHGGEVLLSEQVTCVAHKRGKVTGVVLFGDTEVTGASFVLSDLPTRELLALAEGFALRDKDSAALPHVEIEAHRFHTSLVVRDEGLPAPLSEDALLVPVWGKGQRSTPRVWLSRAPIGEGKSLLSAEALFSDYPETKRRRAAVLSVLESFLPFVERHYLLVDSPHDGLPLWDFRSGARVEVERARLRHEGAMLEPEPMRPRFSISPLSWLDFAGEPLVSPLQGAFHVGPRALPALGQEGELVAAWSAARMITRTDRMREKMRREMWNKVELG